MRPIEMPWTLYRYIFRELLKLLVFGAKLLVLSLDLVLQRGHQVLERLDFAGSHVANWRHFHGGHDRGA